MDPTGFEHNLQTQTHPQMNLAALTGSKRFTGNNLGIKDVDDGDMMY